MDYTQRSSEFIYERLTKVAQMWPENSRSYWAHFEKIDSVGFGRRALCMGFWGPGIGYLASREFWNDVPPTLVKKWMDMFRLLITQTDCMRRLGCNSWREWEEVWLQIVAGQDAWEDPRYDYYFA